MLCAFFDMFCFNCLFQNHLYVAGELDLKAGQASGELLAGSLQAAINASDLEFNISPGLQKYGTSVFDLFVIPLP